MKKKELLEVFSDKSGFRKKDVSAFFELQAEIAYKEASSGDGFTIPGIGKLLLKDRKARIGRNPATGESIKIPAKKVVKFRVAKQAKEGVLSYAPASAKKKKR